MKNLLLIGIMLAASGCALTSKSDALAIRWFSPEVPKTTVTGASTGEPTKGIALELGRVTSGINLRDKIAYRDNAYEVGFYDDKRWTERPEVYVRRELARTLFEAHGVRRALAGTAPTLDVEVLAFDEIRTPSPAARIQLRLVVHDDARALLEKTITIDKPATNKSIDAFVQAMADALTASAETVARDAEAAARGKEE